MKLITNKENKQNQKLVFAMTEKTGKPLAIFIRREKKNLLNSE